jgi:hypothetical protein
MIVNCRETTYVIVELSAEDVESIIKGEIVLENSKAHNDEDVLVKVYCDHPERIRE